MTQKISTIIFSILLVFSLVSPSGGFDSNPNRINPNDPNDKRQRDYTREDTSKPIGQGGYYGGHDTITAESMLLKKEVHKSDSDGGERFKTWADEDSLPSLRTGAHDEDCTKLVGFIPLTDPPIGPNNKIRGNFFDHFYNPDTGKGLKSTWNPATERALDYIEEIRKLTGCSPDAISKLSTENKKKVYDYLGRIMHLLQDMAVPSHTKDDIHVSTEPFEQYVNDNWADIVNSDAFKKAITVDQYLSGNCAGIGSLHPEELMKDLADFSHSHEYYSQEELYDIESGVNENGEIVIRKVLNKDKLMKNVNDLIPKAIIHTACYIDSIYDALTSGAGSNDICKPTLPELTSPGGDHPDDRFDVSDEFYWEKEYGLSDADLTDLYMRTAIKKGKIGVWYKKRFMDIFAEGRTKYIDAPQEVKDRIEAEFQAMGQKLEQRIDYAESDWKGAPDIALFAYGFYNPSISLMLKFKEPVAFTGLDFDPSIVKDHPVMLVPSGGFYGLENSKVLKAQLSEYVKNGGTLIIFAQQHGYEFSLLPVPQEADGTYKTITGYGWTEDQSCFTNSAYIDTYHQILSGQSRSTPTLNVDGYFTNYPSNSIVLLRRTANGQPAMLMYDYGQGKVMVTSMYSDWAYGHSQASKEEIALVRDMISWAKKPDVLPEIKPGEEVNLNINLSNFADQNAASVKFIILNPDRNIINEQTQAIAIPAGQSAIIPVSHTSSLTSALGIYHIDYELYDAQGNIIQPQAETDSGRFAVSNPPASSYEISGLRMSVTTPSESVISGQDVPITVTLWNYTETDDRIRLYQGWNHMQRTFLDEVTVPAKGTVSKNYTISNPTSGRSLWIDVFSENVLKLTSKAAYHFTGEIWPYAGSYGKGFNIIYPSVSLTTITDKTLYAKGETVTINTSLKNNIPASWQADMKTSVTDPKDEEVFEGTETINLSPSGTTNITTSFNLPSTLAIGTYIVRVEVRYETEPVSSTSTRFELPHSQISVTPSLPSAFISGNNTITFSITNTGRINVYSGGLDISLRDPDGSTVYSGSQPFILSAGESKILDVPISIPSLKFGNYILIYTQSDETRTGQPTTIQIPNSTTVTLSFDKSSYVIREIANLALNLTNTGKFNHDNISVTVSVPNANYTNTQTVSLLTANSLPLTYAIPIPESISAGEHNMDIMLALPSGSSMIQSSKLIVPDAFLKIRYTGAKALTAGDVINLAVENVGGVDSSFIIEMTLRGTSGAFTIYQNVINDTIQAGASKTYSFQIPLQAKSDIYLIEAKASGELINLALLSEFIDISGVTAGLSVRTDKDIYLSTESITSLSQIINQTCGIDNANLHLQIVNKCSTGWVESFHVSTWDGSNWVERGVLHYSDTLETQSVDLSAFLPDLAGDYKVRVANMGSVYAYVDYISLTADGITYTPSYANELNRGGDILKYITDADGWAVNVRNNTIEIQWTGIPLAANKILLMRAMEEKINLCGESIYWQTDILINQAANTIVDLRHAVGQLSEKGQLYLQGILSSQTGQIIAYAEYPFSVIGGDIALHFRTDKPVYRAGEIVRITGKVMNLAPVGAEGITLEIYEDFSALYTETFTISANGNHTFSFTTIAGSEGTYRLSGKVTQNNSTLIEISDQYKVASPKVPVTVAAPQVVGNEPFNINVEMKNEGKMGANIQISVISNQEDTIDTQQITILAGETKLIQYRQQITGDTTYTFTFTGDINQTITRTVLYGLTAAIAINPSNVYPEGKVAIPVTVTNTGQLDETLEVSFQLSRESGVVSQQSKAYYLSAGTSTTVTLYFDLSEGSYQLSAISQQPAVSAQANFSVKKENKVEMSISVGAQTGEYISVTVSLTNIGYNEINGGIQLSIVSNQGQIAWSSEQTVSQISPLNSQLLTLDINPSAIVPGDYILKVELLNNSNQQLAVSTQQLTIKGPIFQITQLPSYQTFTAGQGATFTFKVKNTGNHEGPFELNFRANDFIDLTQREWLLPDVEKTKTFSFMLPEDLEEKDYFADYELKSVSGQSTTHGQLAVKGKIKYHIAGINLNVSAYLDKQYYRVGDTARLAIDVSQSSSGSLNLFARVNYNGYESQQAFTLSSTKTLTFDIPLTESTEEKLFYGIYHESGRSIHLNSLYVHEAGDVIMITTDRQVYNPAETVSVTVSSANGITGTMTLTSTNYEETFAFTGTATRSFVLPSIITAGTYSINAQLSTPNSELITVTYPFDVAGIQVKVKEATLDKAKYASADTLNLRLTIESNQNISAILKTWIVDPEGKYTVAGERNINLSSTDNLLITHNSSLVTDVSGIHRLVYGIYTSESGDPGLPNSGLLLVSGSEAFDVGDAILTGISTDKADYLANTEFVHVTASMFGTVDASLKLLLDNNTINTQMVSLNGFYSLNIYVGTVEPGTHILKAILTSGGTKSTKEATFTYALSLLDSDNDGMPDGWENTYGLDSSNPADANSDPDNDLLTNLQEYQRGTNPNNPDTDNDGMTDGWEVKYDLNPNANDASSDKDNDGFSNLQEYQSGSNPSDPTIMPDQPPVANAGSDQNVITGTLVTLNGSESFDPEGAMITLLWTFVELPAGSNITDISLSDATSPKPTFIPDVNGTYTLELIVSDGVLESAPDEVAIIASTPNVAPNANAGPDQSVYTGATVYLDSSASYDPDNGPQPLSYLWTFDSIPSGSYLTNDHITNKDQVSASFIPDIDGSYVINLMVSDGEFSSLDTVSIMATTPNVPPNANAGPDITVYLGQTAILAGSASNDPDYGPMPLSYKWRFVAIPSGSQLNNEDITGAETVSPSFTPDVSGTYVIELMVSDGIDVSFDNIAVTVIKKAVFCSILGSNPKPSILDQDVFKFLGTKEETVTIQLEANPPEVGSGKRATLTLIDKIKGALLLKIDSSKLPNEIRATLPSMGEYLIIVAEQPKIARGERYRGAYCLSLEASQETMQTLKPAFWVE